MRLLHEIRPGSVKAATAWLAVASFLCLLSPAPAWAADETAAPGTRSWIEVDASNGGKPLVSGDAWPIPVEYSVDPAEFREGMVLSIWGTGPFVDVPDGKYATKRGHIGYPGLSGRVTLPRAGRGRHVFRLTVPEALDGVRRNNPVLFLVGFRDASGREWPWNVRTNNSFVRREGFFEIETATPRHLFTYDEPVQVLARLKNVQQAGERKTLSWKAYDTAGDLAARGQQEFAVHRDGQAIAVDLELERRGVFLVEFDVPGWETRRTTLARIPDVRAITRGQPTPFGMTTHWDAPPEEVWAVAERLGLSSCRRFTRWYRLQPGPDRYRLDGLAAELDVAARYGVRVWLCLVEPPPFAFPGEVSASSYRAVECRWDVWREFVRTATTRLEGRLHGWEWLNEITPGGVEDPVRSYLTMCRIGTETARAIDPGLRTILAGGLFPRSFRQEMLAAGVGRYIDTLPVHYQNGDGVREAREDLESAGLANVAVWDDESARGVNAWGVPPLEDLCNTEQSEWVLRQWPDELAAGCQRIVYFGGAGSATGGWDYLLDDLGPRPVAAAIAVLAAKLAGARPLGTFLLGEGCLFHLFERDGQAVLVASGHDEAGETVPLHVGARRLVRTDYQGNESPLDVTGGVARLELRRLPCFVEGADPDVVKAYVTARLEVARVGAGTSSGVRRAHRTTPRIAALVARPARLPVRLENLYDRVYSGTVFVELPPGWPGVRRQQFSLRPGQSTDLILELAAPAGTAAEDHPARIVVRPTWKKLPQIELPLVLSVIDHDMLGNLVPNGGFETPNAAGDGPEGWKVNGQTKLWASAAGLGDGLGRRVLRFQDTSGWDYCSRAIPVRGGQTYLYTAWVRNQDMGCGSNMTLRLAGGGEVRLYDTQVFSCGENNPYWQLFTCRKQMPPDAERASFTPVANGPGWALYDNIRVTIFEGTDYAAEAHHAARPPRVDGRLDEWATACPIPLLGSNQLTRETDDYSWTPDNLSAVAYLMWDESNLYVAAQVRDDVHHPAGAADATGASILQGDSLVLAIDPVRGGPAAGSLAAAYYLSSAPPGGGSGQHTLFRPPEHDGGRVPGHLFKDSSIYDLAVAESPGVRTYELRIPLAEIGVEPGPGAKCGLSLELIDNDGRGRTARMHWGQGISPAWRPGDFGVAVLVE